MRIEIDNDRVVAFLKGKINSENSTRVQEELNDVIARNPGRRLEIDAGELTYISSAGLRVLLQIRKNMGRPLTVRNVSPEIHDIMEVTGFTSLLDVKKKLREISVEGCEVVGRGAIGTVYRMDEDTIVKVYEIPDCLPMIENEQRRAKQAFMKGIPTAISYDVVKVGDKYGSVFELLKATTYNDIILRHPERLDEVVRQYAAFIRSLHAVETEPGELPEAKRVFLGYLDGLRAVLPGALVERLRALFEAMPEDLHVIHGDIQMKNVMVSDDQPILIDMDTLSMGDPVFDLMSLYVAYVQFNEDDPNNSERFFGFPEAVSRSLWNGLVRWYFEGLDEEALEEKIRRITVVALVRFIYLIAVMDIGEPDLKAIRFEHALARLEELAWQVEGLAVREQRPGSEGNSGDVP